MGVLLGYALAARASTSRTTPWCHALPVRGLTSPASFMREATAFAPSPSAWSRWSLRRILSSAGTSTTRSARSAVISTGYADPMLTPACSRAARDIPIRLSPPMRASRSGSVTINLGNGLNAWGLANDFYVGGNMSLTGGTGDDNLILFTTVSGGTVRGNLTVNLGHGLNDFTLNGSFTLQDSPEFYPAGSFEDPSNIVNRDGGQYAPQVGGSGIDNVFSYCEDEYNEAFAGISSVFDATIPALCMPVCVEDEGTCELVHVENGQFVEIPRCGLDSDQLPALDGEQLCFFSLVGTAASDECRAQGWNVQFGFLNADGVDIPKQVYAACAPANASKPECATTADPSAGQSPRR